MAQKGFWVEQLFQLLDWCLFGAFEDFGMVPETQIWHNYFSYLIPVRMNAQPQKIPRLISNLGIYSF